MHLNRSTWWALAIVLATIAGAEARTVTVGAGETLAGIAQRELGSARRWAELCELNKAVVRNCNNLPAGVILQLPEEDSGDGSAQSTGAPDLSAQPPQPAAEAAPAEVTPATRTNLLPFPQFFDDAGWSGYFVRPAVSAGHVDPRGGSSATRFESADAPDSPGGGFSGVIRDGTLPAGTYTAGVWLRSVSGTQMVRFGLSDAYLSDAVSIDESWRYFQATFSVSDGTDRVFEVVESTPANAAWEIFGAAVEAGQASSPFYPAN